MSDPTPTTTSAADASAQAAQRNAAETEALADETAIFEDAPADAKEAPVFTTETPRKGIDGPRLALRAGAEFAGTALAIFPLLIVYTLSQLIYQYSGLMPIIAVTALSYGAVSAMLGRVSGAHLNPAVTVAAMLTSKTGWLEGAAYIVAQVLGGLAAAGLYALVLPVSESVPSSTWMTMAVKGFDEASRSSGALTNAGISFGSTFAVIVELLAGLVIVGTAVATLRKDGTADSSHAWATGLAYGLGAAFAYPVTGASLNPAHATGVAIVAQGKGLSVEPLGQLWVFWIAPLFAAAIVAIAMIVTAMVDGAAQHGAASSVIVFDEQDEQQDADDDAAGDAEAGAETDAAAESSADAAEAGEPAQEPQEQASVEDQGQVEHAEAESKAEADERVERN